MTKTTATKAVPNPTPLLNVDLSAWSLALVTLVLAAGPLFRGLFFRPDALLAQMTAAVVFILALLDFGVQRQPLPRTEPLDIAIFLLPLAYLAAFPGAVNQGESLAEVLQFSAYFLVYWAVARVANIRRRQVFLSGTVVAAGVAVSVIGLAAATGYLVYPGAWNGLYISSTFQYRNALAGYLIAAQVLGLGLLLVARNPALKVALGAANFITGLTLLLTQSRGAWLIYPVILLIWLLGVLPEKRWRAGWYVFVNLGLILFAARVFLPLAVEGRGRAAIAVLVAAVALAALVHLATAFGHLISDRLNLTSLQARVINYLALGYAALVLAVYTFYTYRALPRWGLQFLPPELLRRVESIALADSSLQGRLAYYRDAWEIIRNHPLFGAGGGGWNALYHRYQSELYYSTEVHNQFVQTWVEAGTVGLVLYLAVWVLLGFALYQAYRRRAQQPESWNLSWGLGMAVLGLLVHSAIDFDLSLPAIALTLWALVGLTRASTADSGTPPEKPERTLSRAHYVLPALGTVMAVLVLICSWRFYQAGVVGAEGARALNNQDYPRAMELITKARDLDPFTGSYAADLAQLNAALAVLNNEPARQAQADTYAKQAAELEPFNPKIRVTTATAYLIMGWVDQAVGEAYSLLEINPLDQNTYDFYASTALTAARLYAVQGEEAMARQYLDRVLSLPSLVASRAQKMTDAGTSPVALSPGIHLRLGQAYYLKGDWRQAREELVLAQENQGLTEEAALWLSAVERKAFGSGEADSGAPAADSQELQRVLDLPVL